MTHANAAGADEADLVLSVPARVDSAKVIRSVTRVAATLAGLSVEEMDDLCLASDEAFSALMSGCADGERVSMTIRRWSQRLGLTFSFESSVREWSLDGARRTLAWQVLSALTDDLELDTGSAAPSIRFSKQRSRAPETGAGIG